MSLTKDFLKLKVEALTKHLQPEDILEMTHEPKRWEVIRPPRRLLTEIRRKEALEFIRKRASEYIEYRNTGTVLLPLTTRFESGALSEEDDYIGPDTSSDVEEHQLDETVFEVDQPEKETTVTKKQQQKTPGDNFYNSLEPFVHLDSLGSNDLRDTTEAIKHEVKQLTSQLETNLLPGGAEPANDEARAEDEAEGRAKGKDEDEEEYENELTLLGDVELGADDDGIPEAEADAEAEDDGIPEAEADAEAEDDGIPEAEAEAEADAVAEAEAEAEVDDDKREDALNDEPEADAKELEEYTTVSDFTTDAAIFTFHFTKPVQTTFSQQSTVANSIFHVYTVNAYSFGFLDEPNAKSLQQKDQPIQNTLNFIRQFIDKNKDTIIKSFQDPRLQKLVVSKSFIDFMLGVFADERPLQITSRTQSNNLNKLKQALELLEQDLEWAEFVQNAFDELKHYCLEHKDREFFKYVINIPIGYTGSETFCKALNKEIQLIVDNYNDFKTIIKKNSRNKFYENILVVLKENEAYENATVDVNQQKKILTIIKKEISKMHKNADFFFGASALFRNAASDYLTCTGDNMLLKRMKALKKTPNNAEARNTVSHQRVARLYDVNECFVNVDRPFLIQASGQTTDTAQVQASEVQRWAFQNANKFWHERNNHVLDQQNQITQPNSMLYMWATGSGKTSAMIAEVIAAGLAGIQTAYVCTIRLGTVREIYYGLKNSHVNEIKTLLDISNITDVEVVSEIYTNMHEQNPTKFNTSPDNPVPTSIPDSPMIILKVTFKTGEKEHTIDCFCSLRRYFSKVHIHESERTARYSENHVCLGRLYSNHPRVLIVDEAHEFRLNDVFQIFFDPDYDNKLPKNQLTNQGVKKWKHSETNTVVKLFAGEFGSLTKWPHKSSQVCNKRLVFLTATPAGQKSDDVVNLFMTMFYMGSTKEQVFAAFPDVDVFKNKVRQNINQLNRIFNSTSKSYADKQMYKNFTLSQTALQTLLHSCNVGISIDLLNSQNMPLTNYSCTNTGLGFGGLSTTENQPIEIFLEPDDPFHLLQMFIREPVFWNFVIPIGPDPVTQSTNFKTEFSTYIDHFKNIYNEYDALAPQPRLPDETIVPGKYVFQIGSKASGVVELEADYTMRLTNAAYFFKTTFNTWAPFPAYYSHNNAQVLQLHHDIFRLENKMFNNIDMFLKFLTNDRSTHVSFLDSKTIDDEKSFLEMLGYATNQHTFVNVPDNANPFKTIIRHLLGIATDSTHDIIQTKLKQGFSVQNTDARIKCICPKLDFLCYHVNGNTTCPSVVFVKDNNFAGSDHVAMVLERSYEITHANLKDVENKNPLTPKKRSLILNYKTTPGQRDAVTDQDTGVFNLDNNIHGEFIKCLILVQGSSASITLRNVFVSHYLNDEQYILQYVQSLGRTARRSNFIINDPNRNKLFGFTCDIIPPQQGPNESAINVTDNSWKMIKQFAHGEQDSFKKVVNINEKFEYALSKNRFVEIRDNSTPETADGEYHIVKLPVVSYVLYTLHLLPLKSTQGNTTTSLLCYDEYVRQKTIQKAKVYSVVLKALATLSNNCFYNSEYLEQILAIPKGKFKNVCYYSTTDPLAEIVQNLPNLFSEFFENKLTSETFTIESILKTHKIALTTDILDAANAAMDEFIQDTKTTYKIQKEQLNTDWVYRRTIKSDKELYQKPFHLTISKHLPIKLFQ